MCLMPPRPILRPCVITLVDKVLDLCGLNPILLRQLPLCTRTTLLLVTTRQSGLDEGGRVH